MLNVRKVNLVCKYVKVMLKKCDNLGGEWINKNVVHCSSAVIFQDVLHSALAVQGFELGSLMFTYLSLFLSSI